MSVIFSKNIGSPGFWPAVEMPVKIWVLGQAGVEQVLGFIFREVNLVGFLGGGFWGVGSTGRDVFEVRVGWEIGVGGVGGVGVGFGVLEGLG